MTPVRVKNKISRGIVQLAMLLLFVAHIGLAQTAAPSEKPLGIPSKKISKAQGWSSDKCAHVQHPECALPIIQALSKFLGGAQTARRSK